MFIGFHCEHVVHSVVFIFSNCSLFVDIYLFLSSHIYCEKEYWKNHENRT